MAQGFKHGDSGWIANKIPEFTYTGSYQFIDDGDKNWRIKLFTGGDFVFTSLGNAAKGIDVFCVGGGGGGAGSGGGGGYTKTVKNVTVQKNTTYTVQIGAGGAQSNTSYAYNGGATSGFGVSASGGYCANANNHTGGSGGSGGGSYVGGNGGSNGGNGAKGGKGDYTPGTGQGTTTREFGESGATLYSGGGGAGSHKDTSTSYGTGGAGGGANGSKNARGQSASANTGGGGGGGISGDWGCGGAGGSGIVVIRNVREVA